MLHEAYHVVVLLGFVVGVGMAFVGALAPVLFADRKGLRLPRFRSSILIGVGALSLLFADWLVHRL